MEWTVSDYGGPECEQPVVGERDDALEELAPISPFTFIFSDVQTFKLTQDLFSVENFKRAPSFSCTFACCSLHLRYYKLDSFSIT